MSPWTAARQAPLSFTISKSLLKFMSLESMMLTISSSTTLFSYLQSFPEVYKGSKIYFIRMLHLILDKGHEVSFPLSSVVKQSACSAVDLGSIPGLGRYPGEENGNPLQYSCLENPMDRGT